MYILLSRLMSRIEPPVLKRLDQSSGNLVSNFGGELLTPLYLFDQTSVRVPMLSPHVPARNILEVDSDR